MSGADEPPTDVGEMSGDVAQELAARVVAAVASAFELEISPEQAHDAVLINVPSDKVKDGINTFAIQDLSPGGNTSGTLENLAKYRFRVRIQS